MDLDRILVLDFETTGLDRNADFVTEIGALLIHDGQAIGSFSAVVNFGGVIPKMITKITGITQAQINAGMPKDFAFRVLRGMMAGAVIVAHNAVFDLGFLYREMGDRLHLDFAHHLPPNFLCTATVAAILAPGESHSLANLCQKYGIQNQRAHRAIYDARATYSLFCELRRQTPLEQYINVLGYPTERGAPAWAPENSTLKAY
jgi:DNA polymerase III subunit epsilon